MTLDDIGLVVNLDVMDFLHFFFDRSIRIDELFIYNLQSLFVIYIFHHLPSSSIIFHGFSIIFHGFSIIFHGFSIIFHHLPSSSMDFPSSSIIFHHFPSSSIIFPWIFHHLPSFSHHFPWIFVHRRWWRCQADRWRRRWRELQPAVMAWIGPECAVAHVDPWHDQGGYKKQRQRINKNQILWHFMTFYDNLKNIHFTWFYILAVLAAWQLRHRYSTSSFFHSTIFHHWEPWNHEISWDIMGYHAISWDIMRYQGS